MFSFIPKLRELILFPIVSPKAFLDEIKDVLNMQLEVLQLGIMNLSVAELKRIFSEVFESFPNL
jgi:hypothetical protein